VGSNCTNK